MADKKTELAKTQPALPAELAEMVTAERPTSVGVGVTFDKDDIAMPRLALVQKTSKELEPRDPKYIADAKFGDIFHSGDRTCFGAGPIYFAVLRHYGPRHIEFRPMDEGGGILDMNVPAGDPRTQFTKDAQGNSVAPRATKFLDYVVLLLNRFDPASPMDSIVALSLKSTGLKAAKELNRLMQWRGKKDEYLGVYKATTDTDSNKKGSFAIWKFVNAGWLKEGTPVCEAAREAWEALKDKEVTIDREPGADDGDGFDPEELERQHQVAQGQAPVGAQTEM